MQYLITQMTMSSVSNNMIIFKRSDSTHETKQLPGSKCFPYYKSCPQGWMQDIEVCCAKSLILNFFLLTPLSLRSLIRSWFVFPSFMASCLLVLKIPTYAQPIRFIIQHYDISVSPYYKLTIWTYHSTWAPRHCFSETPWSAWFLQRLLQSHSTSWKPSAWYHQESDLARSDLPPCGI